MCPEQGLVRVAQCVASDGARLVGIGRARVVEEVDKKSGLGQAPSYRWVILGLFAVMNIVNGVCQFQASFFAQDIMADFDVGTSGFTLMTAFPMMFGLLMSLAAGSLSDRFGQRKVLFVALLISATGAILRYFCTVYIALLLMSFLLGVAATFITVNVIKMAMAWFPQRQMGLAIGVGNASGTAGMAFAQAFMGILFPDYRSAFLWCGIAMVVVMVLWGIFGRDRVIVPPEDELPEEETKKGSFKDVMKSRGTWLAGIGGALYNGFNVTAAGLLITALAVCWTMDPVMAGIIASVFTVGMVVGGTFMPAVIMHLKAAKPICIAMPICAVVLFLLGWYIDNTVIRMILFPIAGFCFGSIFPIFSSFPSVLPEISSDNAGSAGGLLTTVSMIGAVVFPTFIITPIAGTDYNLIILLACGFMALCAVIFAVLPSISGNTKK